MTNEKKVRVKCKKCDSVLTEKDIRAVVVNEDYCMKCDSQLFDERLEDHEFEVLNSYLRRGESNG